MKLGASTLAGINNKLEDSLEFIENLGLEYAEILHQYPNQDINIDNVESFNLKYSMHAPFMDVNIASLNRKSRKNSIEQIKQTIDIANKINAECVVIHPGLVPFLAKGFEKVVYTLTNESIKELGDYGQDLGVMVTIENMPSFEAMMYQKLEDLNETLSSLDMFMTLDVGHANQAGYSANQMYYDCIKHLHVHDNFGDDDTHLALGEGSIDLKSIINDFEDKNYDGIYIIEVNDNDSIEKSYNYIKENF